MTNNVKLKTKNLKTPRGFSLIETLVAVLLLATAITGPLTIASKSFLVATVAKDQVTAFYLAQDAVEYVRFARDSNKLSGSDWLSGSVVDLDNCVSTNGCYFDSLDPETPPVACQSSGCKTMTHNSATHSYDYFTADGTPPFFVRTVKIVDAVHEATLTVQVSWKGSGNITRSVKVTEQLFDWQ